jgi:hypothetical protein
MCTLCAIGSLDLRIDSAHHTGLAMLSLGAIEPNRLRVRNPYGVREDLVLSRDGSVCGHEAGEEGVGLVGHDVLDGDAWVVEGRLDYRVVLGIASVMPLGRLMWKGGGKTYLRMELELHQIARHRLDIIRQKGQAAI